MRRSSVGALVLFLCATTAPAALRVNGSTTVNPVISQAAEILRREASIEIQVDTVGGSSGGIAALGDGRAEIAMSSRPLSRRDRERFPEVDFRAVRIGTDALALVVSGDVWNGGVRCLSRGQARGLYEGRIRNWRELGGPDQRIAFFNKEPGRGTWEVFAGWLYGDADSAPLVSLLEVGSNEEARSKVGSTRGAITQLSAAWADGETTFPLSICEDDGDEVAPTRASILAGDYPLARALYVVTDGPAEGAARRLIDLVLSERGQVIVERHGYMALTAPVQAGGAHP